MAMKRFSNALKMGGDEHDRKNAFIFALLAFINLLLWFHLTLLNTYEESHARWCVLIKAQMANFGSRVPSTKVRSCSVCVEMNGRRYILWRQRATSVSATSWGGGVKLSPALRFDSSVSSIQSHSSVSDMGANSSNVSSLFLLTCVERCRIANPARFNPAHNGHVALHYRRYCGAQSITFRN